MIKKLNDIAASKKLIEKLLYSERISILALASLTKIGMNGKGKDECTQQKVIKTANHYLTSDVFYEAYYASLLIMMCTIQLNGKEQAIEPEDDHIIKNLVSLLDYENEDLRANIK